MARKKKSRVEVKIRVEGTTLAFYEGVAAYAGVTVDDAINVILAVSMLTRISVPQTGNNDA